MPLRYGPVGWVRFPWSAAAWSGDAGGTGYIDAGRVDKRAEAPGGQAISVVNPSTRSFFASGRRPLAQTRPQRSGWKGSPDDPAAVRHPVRSHHEVCTPDERSPARR